MHRGGWDYHKLLQVDTVLGAIIALALTTRGSDSLTKTRSNSPVTNGHGLLWWPEPPRSRLAWNAWCHCDHVGSIKGIVWQRDATRSWSWLDMASKLCSKAGAPIMSNEVSRLDPFGRLLCWLECIFLGQGSVELLQSNCPSCEADAEWNTVHTDEQTPTESSRRQRWTIPRGQPTPGNLEMGL